MFANDGIWECAQCGLKSWSLGNPFACSHCGGTMEKVGKINRYSPTTQELDDFEEGLEAFRDGN